MVEDGFYFFMKGYEIWVYLVFEKFFMFYSIIMGMIIKVIVEIDVIVMK